MKLENNSQANQSNEVPTIENAEPISQQDWSRTEQQSSQMISQICKMITEMAPNSPSGLQSLPRVSFVGPQDGSQANNKNGNEHRNPMNGGSDKGTNELKPTAALEKEIANKTKPEQMKPSSYEHTGANSKDKNCLDKNEQSFREALRKIVEGKGSARHSDHAEGKESDSFSKAVRQTAVDRVAKDMEASGAIIIKPVHGLDTQTKVHGGSLPSDGRLPIFRPVTPPGGRPVVVPPGDGVIVPPGGNPVVVPPGHGIVVPPGGKPVVVPGSGDGGLVPPRDGGLVPPRDGGLVPPRDRGLVRSHEQSDV